MFINLSHGFRVQTQVWNLQSQVFETHIWELQTYEYKFKTYVWTRNPWLRFINIGVSIIVQIEYSRLSLSRLRLSRITAYLEEKIWSLF